MIASNSTTPRLITNTLHFCFDTNSEKKDEFLYRKRIIKPGKNYQSYSRWIFLLDH